MLEPQKLLSIWSKIGAVSPSPGIFWGWGFISVGWGYPTKKPPLVSQIKTWIEYKNKEFFVRYIQFRFKSVYKYRKSPWEMRNFRKFKREKIGFFIGSWVNRLGRSRFWGWNSDRTFILTLQHSFIYQSKA